MENNHYPFVNLPLPYDYDAMEPYIDRKTMQLHHDKHLQTYIDNLNKALADQPKLQDLTLEQLIYNWSKLPKNIRESVKNNAGGVYNHRFYFDQLQNPAPIEPSGPISKGINEEFGSFANFKTKFKEEALSVFGSGYAWLVLDRNKLRIMKTPNQDNPHMFKMCPILVVDVWEHAYYLKHYNVRADYIDNWFSIINWDKVNENYTKCLKG